jgi:hypothetical protein
VQEGTNVLATTIVFPSLENLCKCAIALSGTRISIALGVGATEDVTVVQDGAVVQLYYFYYHYYLRCALNYATSAYTAQLHFKCTIWLFALLLHLIVWC